MTDQSNNFYKLLEINSDATDSEIKKAYRKMALRWHPDKNTNNKLQAEKKFKAISNAYEVLSDPIKRKSYDGRNLIASDLNSFSCNFDFKNEFDVFTNFFGGRNPFNEADFSFSSNINHSTQPSNSFAFNADSGSKIITRTSSTKIKNGNSVVIETITTIENGISTCIVKENGRILSKTINGLPVELQ